MKKVGEIVFDRLMYGDNPEIQRCLAYLNGLYRINYIHVTEDEEKYTFCMEFRNWTNLTRSVKKCDFTGGKQVERLIEKWIGEIRKC